LKKSEKSQNQKSAEMAVEEKDGQHMAAEFEPSEERGSFFQAKSFHILFFLPSFLSIFLVFTVKPRIQLLWKTPQAHNKQTNKPQFQMEETYARYHSNSYLFPNWSTLPIIDTFMHILPGLSPCFCCMCIYICVCLMEKHAFI
jgi:hypothetical protein